MKKLIELLVLIPTLILLLLTNSCEQLVSVSPPPGEVTNTALLFVNSNPSGANIYINGKIAGEITPDTVKWLNEGNYALTLKKDLFRDTTLTINVSRDSTSIVNINYLNAPNMRGSIYSDTSPLGASIFLNDSATGKTSPASLENLIPGYYNVTYRKTGYWDYKKIIAVESNKKTYDFVSLNDTSTWITFNSSNSELTTDFLHCIALDNSSVKWIGSFGGGLFRFDEREWINYNTDNSPLPSNNINSITIDLQNRKWISTENGLAVLDGENWTVYSTSNSGLPSNSISDVGIDQENKKWIGTAGKGLVVFDDINWIVYDTSIPGFPNDNITAVTIKKDSSVWVGTNGGGVVKYNGSTFKVYDVTNTSIGFFNHGFPTNNIGAIAMLEDSIVWIGFGFDLGSPGGTSYLKYRFWNKRIGLPSDEVKTIAGDSNNLVWLGNSDAGLSKFDYTTFTTYNTSNSKIGSNSIMDIVIDKNNVKWLATLNGLVKYKGN